MIASQQVLTTFTWAKITRESGQDLRGLLFRRPGYDRATTSLMWQGATSVPERKKERKKQSKLLQAFHGK
jgi:hypothetical protein